MAQSDRAVLPLAKPAGASAPQVQPSPLDALLQSAVEQSTDSAVVRWLQALLTGERAGGQPGPEK